MTRMLSGVLCVLLAVACSKKNTIAPPSSGDSTITGNNPGKTGTYREDTSFRPTGDFITLIAVQKDGKILIANPDGIGRINRDGTKDNSFAVSSCGGGQIHCIALQDNGQILLGGSFLTFNGAKTPYFLRLNSDGSPDNSFVKNEIFDEGYVSEDVRTIGIQKDGKILVGGSFDWKTGTTSGGTVFLDQEALVRLNANGSFDPSWQGFPKYYMPGIYSVDAIKVQTDGKILISGGVTFYDADSNSYFGVVRLYPDRTVDTTFKWTAGAGMLEYAAYPGKIYYNVLTPLNDGSILVGGRFNQVTATPGAAVQGCGGFVKASKTGSIDFSFNRYFASWMKAICLFNDTTIFMGDVHDSTETYGSQIGCAAFKLDGSKDKTYDLKSPPTGDIYSIVKESDSTLLIAGRIMTGYQNGQLVYKGLSRIVKR